MWAFAGLLLSPPTILRLDAPDLEESEESYRCAEHVDGGYEEHDEEFGRDVADMGLHCQFVLLEVGILKCRTIGILY